VTDNLAWLALYSAPEQYNDSYVAAVSTVRTLNAAVNVSQTGDILHSVRAAVAAYFETPVATYG